MLVERCKKKVNLHLADAFQSNSSPKQLTVIHSLMAVAPMQSADQHIISSLGFGILSKDTLILILILIWYADQGNRTSNFPITRCWLYSCIHAINWYLPWFYTDTWAHCSYFQFFSFLYALQTKYFGNNTYTVKCYTAGDYFPCFVCKIGCLGLSAWHITIIVWSNFFFICMEG